jgi:hypothetical protein
VTCYSAVVPSVGPIWLFNDDVTVMVCKVISLCTRDHVVRLLVIRLWREHSFICASTLSFFGMWFVNLIKFLFLRINTTLVLYLGNIAGSYFTVLLIFFTSHQVSGYCL